MLKVFIEIIFKVSEISASVIDGWTTKVGGPGQIKIKVWAVQGMAYCLCLKQQQKHKGGIFNDIKYHILFIALNINNIKTGADWKMSLLCVYPRDAGYKLGDP